ncbi:MAG: hypothetical protein EOO76_16005 [Novosphingobium sp.]|nr:MAG: hypothetical protein EOO76_16005 [Novosphingobium sp.]
MADLYLSLGEAVDGLTFVNVQATDAPIEPAPVFVAPVASATAGEDDAVELALLQGQIVTLVGFDSVGGIFTI